MVKESLGAPFDSLLGGFLHLELEDPIGGVDLVLEWESGFAGVAFGFLPPREAVSLRKDSCNSQQSVVQCLVDLRSKHCLSS